MSSISRSCAVVLYLVMAGGGLVAPAVAQAPPVAASPAAPTTAPPATPNISANHLAIAVEVLKASGLMVMIENATPNVVDDLRANISRQRPELVKEIEESLVVVQGAVEGVRSEGLINAAGLLAERMSEADLKEINTFLNSSAGKKYVSLLPQYVEDVVPLLEGWGLAAAEKLSRIFQEEMAKRGHKI